MAKKSKFAKEEAAESPAYEAKEQAALKKMGMKKGGEVMAKDAKPTKMYARGGGIEVKGKTRGKFV